MLHYRTGILIEAISMYEIPAYTDNSNFMEKFTQKRVFPVKNRKS